MKTRLVMVVALLMFLAGCEVELRGPDSGHHDHDRDRHEHHDGGEHHDHGDEHHDGGGDHH